MKFNKPSIYKVELNSLLAWSRARVANSIRNCSIFIFHTIFSPWMYECDVSLSQVDTRKEYSAVPSLQFDALNICTATVRMSIGDCQLLNHANAAYACVRVAVGHVTSCHFRLRHTRTRTNPVDGVRCPCRIAITMQMNRGKEQKRLSVRSHSVCSILAFKSIELGPHRYHGFICFVYCLVAQRISHR